MRRVYVRSIKTTESLIGEKEESERAPIIFPSRVKGYWARGRKRNEQVRHHPRSLVTQEFTISSCFYMLNA